jgi:hypothetical protein
MAETVTIASPSYALLAPELGPVIDTAALSKKSRAASKNATAATAPAPAPAKASDSAGVAKRKQSKSRNGTLPPLTHQPRGACWVKETC